MPHARPPKSVQRAERREQLVGPAEIEEGGVDGVLAAEGLQPGGVGDGAFGYGEAGEGCRGVGGCEAGGGRGGEDEAGGFGGGGEEVRDEEAADRAAGGGEEDGFWGHGGGLCVFFLGVCCWSVGLVCCFELLDCVLVRAWRAGVDVGKRW